MKEFLKDCNSFRGRWNRKRFWLYPIAIMIMFVLPTYILFIVGMAMQNDLLILIGGGLTALTYVYLLYVCICSYIKRFHDLGKSGWYSILMFIPFISIIAVIWAGFFKGTVGPNKFGPDPLGGTAVVSHTSEEL